MKSLFSKSGKSKAREGIRLNRRVFTFIICLFVSIAFWLMMSLSKEYSISISFPVNYTNFPSDKIISNHLPETIDIEIKATGFNLLFYKLKQQRETVWLDINDAKAFTTKNHYFLLSNSRIDKITSQFSNEIKVLKINPDTIFLNYNKKITKRVPVIADINIDFDNQYQLTDSIKIEPSSIDISGAADVLEKITYLKTVAVNLKKVATPLILKLGILKSPELKQIELSVTTVQATINVKKFTEASLELPIDVANLPKGYSIKTFPDKVIVKYNVAFDDYLSINSQQFKASVDYSKMESGSNKLKVKLEKFPTNIRSVKLNLDKVEYIIRK